MDPPAVPVTTLSSSAPPAAPPAPTEARELAAWNRALNRTHAMGPWRMQSGWVVRAIEARRRHLVADAVRRLAPRRVVDVGCEDGWIAEAYVDAVDDLVLLDLDPTTLETSGLAQRPNVRIAVADATSASSLAAVLGRAQADVILLSALLEHVPDPRGALAALRSFLAPSGHLVIYLPADRPILAAKQILRHTRTGRLVRGLSLESAPGHLHVFTRARVRRLLRDFGRIERLVFDPLVLGYLAVLRVEANVNVR